jgi:hypothetical protein
MLLICSSHKKIACKTFMQICVTTPNISMQCSTRVLRLLTSCIRCVQVSDSVTYMTYCSLCTFICMLEDINLLRRVSVNRVGKAAAYTTDRGIQIRELHFFILDNWMMRLKLATTMHDHSLPSASSHYLLLLSSFLT